MMFDQSNLANHRRASSFDPYDKLLENVKSRVKEGMKKTEPKPDARRVKTTMAQTIRAQRIQDSDQEAEESSDDDLGWEYSDNDNDDSTVAPIAFRRDLDPEPVQSASATPARRSKTVTALLNGEDYDEMMGQDQMEEAFHGEMKKADMFIDIHERYFRNRMEILEESKEVSLRESKLRLIEDMMQREGIEGMSVKDLEGMLQARKEPTAEEGNTLEPRDKDGKKGKQSYAISKGSSGFERFIPTNVPTLFGSS
ncbi:hypothetical protein HDU77_000645 [Chytriomyces hyalinus]|nr:hypothetical protein HDU77_000645 [Chytriomyces hyalinus]